MSGCPEAGREHSQTAIPSWPMEIFHIIDVMLSGYSSVYLPDLKCKPEEQDESSGKLTLDSRSSTQVLF